MAQLHGKQIQNDSVSLNKLNDSGIVTFTSATMSFDTGSRLQQSDGNINSGTDVVNKNYVDSVAQGLHTKESVRVIATSSITLAGVFVVDGYTLANGDRILVNGQDGSTATFSNGIYVVDAASWSRATDADSMGLSGEVAEGDFVFVAHGNEYTSTGWVLSQTDAVDHYNIQVDTETQKWVQFSMAGIVEAGDGLTKNGILLDVNVGNGISIENDIVVLGGTLSQTTAIDADGNSLFFQNSDLLTIDTNDFDLNFSGSATVSVGSAETGIIYSGTPSNATPLTLIHKDYVDSQIGGLADVDNLSLILNINNEIQISPTAAGQGLTFSEITGVFDIIWGGTSSGLTFSGGDSISVNVDGSTIQINNDGELTVVAGASNPVYQLFIGTQSSGDDFPTGITLSFTPNDYSRIEVFVNGQKQRLGDGVTINVDCYFHVTGKLLTDLVSSDELYWNGIFSGYDLSATDFVEIVYEK